MWGYKMFFLLTQMRAFLRNQTVATELYFIRA